LEKTPKLERKTAIAHDISSFREVKSSQGGEWKTAVLSRLGSTSDRWGYRAEKLLTAHARGAEVLAQAKRWKEMRRRRFSEKTSPSIKGNTEGEVLRGHQGANVIRGTWCKG